MQSLREAEKVSYNTVKPMLPAEAHASRYRIRRAFFRPGAFANRRQAARVAIGKIAPPRNCVASANRAGSEVVRPRGKQRRIRHLRCSNKGHIRRRLRWFPMLLEIPRTQRERQKESGHQQRGGIADQVDGEKRSRIGSCVQFMHPVLKNIRGKLRASSDVLSASQYPSGRGFLAGARLFGQRDKLERRMNCHESAHIGRATGYLPRLVHRLREIPHVAELALSRTT